MSVQFGRWNIDGRPADPGYLQKAKDMLAPYGPDGEGAYIKDGVGILYRAFHTTKESRRESQPLVTPSGTVICWDGRLDNREDLVRELGEPRTSRATDADIVAAAYEAKGTGCFETLIGDWALSVWELKTRSVVLAKDAIGTHHLYYSFDKDEVTWSTILDPLVLLAGKTFTLEEEYIAGWLSFFPATHLTPYVGIHSVPPSCFVRVEPGRQTLRKYWDFDPSKKILYRTDGEYEEHFRTSFREAVRRRLRSDSPILAELSGGMDSSSIVCMADTIIARGAAETPRLDTVSYYDDAEPNWNERPYFTKVEEKRGRIGCHIDAGSRKSFPSKYDQGRFAPTPGSGRHLKDSAKEFLACLTSQENKVVLSGIGGDEVLGGVPTPKPELANLLARAHFRKLLHRLVEWAIATKKPLIYLTTETLRAFLPVGLVGIERHKRPAVWLAPEFVKRHRAAFMGYETPLRVFGPLPGFQENLNALEALRRQLASSAFCAEPPYEKRYTYLDQNLLEFLYAVPREQLIRPHQRRSLMRRALAGIVPPEILNRKRKAFVARSPMVAISADLPRMVKGIEEMASGSLEIVNPAAFAIALQNVQGGLGIPIVPMMRTLEIEYWLRHLKDWNLLRLPTSGCHASLLRVNEAGAF